MPNHRLSLFAVAGSLALAVGASSAQQIQPVPAAFPAAQQGGLTLERIFSSPDFRARGLPALQWEPQGERFLFVDPQGNLVSEDARSGQRATLVTAAKLVPADAGVERRAAGEPTRAKGNQEPIAIEDYQFSADRRKLLIYTNSQPVWRQNTKGTYYVLDLASGRLTPVSRRPGFQLFAKLSPDGRSVGFVRDNNLFVVDLTTGAERQLTRDGSDKIINGTSDWVYEEELDVRDAWRWSPDSRRIAFWRFDTSAGRSFIYALRETDSVYSRPLSVPYPKAGEPNSRVSMHVLELASGATRRLDTGPANADVYLARMDFAPDGQLLIQRLNRHQNRLDLLQANPVSGASRVIFTDTDPAWVDVDDDLRFIAGGRQMLWSSERDGFNHVYLLNRDGTVARQLTRGSWDVTAVHGVDERAGWLYFAAANPTPMQRQLFRVRLDGSGAVERLSPEPGTHAANWSPDFEEFVDIHSRAHQLPTYRLRAAGGEVLRVLEENAGANANLRAAGFTEPRFVRLPVNGVELNAMMIRPANWDSTRRYPVFMYVYGGPGSQTVTDAWAGSRGLWHQYLAQQGYLVVSVDNRGTGARGREFKKQTYRRLGQLEAQDQAAAARYLAGQPYVDPTRVGIWGWSYGGYMTLMALSEPNSPFKAGISVAPVTDWRLYDNIYTERFMRTPRENAAGYDAGAPVRRAGQLSGDLLLIHGTADDNVHFQNATQMVNALQTAGKQFEMMMYPNRNHSISGGNTSLHLFTLMTRWLRDHL